MKGDSSPQKPTDPRSPGWFGCILIIAGLLFLAQNFGYLAPGFWPVLFRFWPVLIILAGVEVLIGKNRGRGIVMAVLSIAVIAAVVTYALSVTGSLDLSSFSWPKINF